MIERKIDAKKSHWNLMNQIVLGMHRCTIILINAIATRNAFLPLFLINGAKKQANGWGEECNWRKNWRNWRMGHTCVFIRAVYNAFDDYIMSQDNVHRNRWIEKEVNQRLLRIKMRFFFLHAASSLSTANGCECIYRVDRKEEIEHFSYIQKRLLQKKTLSV